MRLSVAILIVLSGLSGSVSVAPQETIHPMESCRKPLIWEYRSIPGRSFASLRLRYINAKRAVPLKSMITDLFAS